MTSSHMVLVAKGHTCALSLLILLEGGMFGGQLGHSGLSRGVL